MQWKQIREEIYKIFPDITEGQMGKLEVLIEDIASDAASDAYSRGQGGGMRHPLDMD